MVDSDISVRALKTTLNNTIELFSFFVRGDTILEIADISRLSRSDDNSIKGFQRNEIQSHVKEITNFFNSDNSFMPNAIIMAIGHDVKFKSSRGPSPTNLEDSSTSGILSIPIGVKGRKCAWIVDGQQRSIALSRSTNKSLIVPVIAFKSDDINLQREQFILVNKAKPIPSRFLNELLPETQSIMLPKDLSARKVPSELCNLLNNDSNSPFHSIIKRPSQTSNENAVVIDSAIIKMIQNSINNPLGALANYKNCSKVDIESMYVTLLEFWSSVKCVFNDAWGLDPRNSRLMHSVGIESMGVIMDRIWSRHFLNKNQDFKSIINLELSQMAPHCAWISGEWTQGFAWNELQNNSKDLKRLKDTLLKIYSESTRS